MKLFCLITLIFFSLITQAQSIISPAPIGGEIVLSQINSYIYFTNPTISQLQLNLSVGSNPHGIKLEVTRCSPPVRKYQSCYIIVSFQNYIYNNQEISLPLMDGAIQLANLVFHPVVSLNQGSSFSVSSMSVDNFDLVSVVIQNKTSSSKSYNPVLSGIDSSKYSIILNRCSGNVIHNGTCLVYFKLKPQLRGTYSAVISEPQVTNSVSISSIISGSSPGAIDDPIANITVNPSSLNFGTIKNLGKTSSRSITITNTGNIPISPIINVSGAGLEISLNRCLLLLSPNQTCSVSVLINVTSALFNGTQSGLFISTQANISSSVIYTPVSAFLDINPILVGSDPGGTSSTYNPTYSNYSPILNVCDGTVPLTRTITQCFGVVENTFVSTGLCVDPTPTILGKSPAGNVTENIISGTEIYHCSLGSNIKEFVSRTCDSPSLDNGEFCSIDLIYFAGRFGGNGSPANLFVSDGTAIGTKSLKSTASGGPSVQVSDFFSFNGKIFFVAQDPVNGSELWTSNGTSSGTVLIKDINPGVSSSTINQLSAFTRLNKTQVLFTANDGTNGLELWITDGTTAGTNMVKDIFSGITGSNISKFAVLNGKAFFAAKSSTSLGLEPWVTDGTESGTYMLKDIVTTVNGTSSPSNFTVFNNKIFFSATTVANGSELWISDGTSSGTQLFKDITGNANGSSPGELTIFGNELFFAAQGSYATGRELWKTDGTPNGTLMVKDIVSGSLGSFPSGLVVSGNKLYFTTGNSPSGLEPWVSDGTSSGTLLLKDIMPGLTNSLPSGFTYYNGLTYFIALSAASTYDIYVTDGTTVGTSLFNKINPYGTSITQSNFVILNNLLYFSGSDGNTGSEIYVTDGTVAGTRLLIDINGTNESSLFGKLYFVQLTPLIP